MKFKGCKNLSFENNYSQCEKVIVGNHVCWERTFAEGDMPKLVQFCKLRGRINSSTGCIGDCNKICSDYEDFEHDVVD